MAVGGAGGVIAMAQGRIRRVRLVIFFGGVAAIALLFACEHARYWRGAEPYDPVFIEKMSDPQAAEAELRRRMAPPAPKAQSAEQAMAKSAGCVSCHGPTDEPDMHVGRQLAIGCVDCHGGDATVMSPLAEPGRPGALGTPIEDRRYLARMQGAHVQPRNPVAWYSRNDLLDGRPWGQHVHEDPTRLHGSRNPPATAALLNQETPEFIRFINPGDLRVASFACGACHAREVAFVGHSMMAHGAQLWGAALYNNGAIPNKIPRYGESYSPFGIPQRLQGVIEIGKDGQVVVRDPSEEEVKKHGVVKALEPLPVWNISQPGNILRVFERGTRLPIPGGPTPNPTPAEIGNPNPLAEGGRPDKGLSVRGLGTLNRTDPVFLGLQKTRLLDPILSFLGTNDHPGDYRSSGCTACHTPYANDRDPFSSGPYAVFGHTGRTASVDPTVPHDEPGHPIKHVLTTAIANSQCVVCHIHPGTSYANTYLGYMWWDNESDGRFMYPATSHEPTPEQLWRALRKNPEGSQLRGLWGDLYPEAASHAGQVAGEGFLEKTGQPRAGLVDPLDPNNVTRVVRGQATLNDRLEHNQFADFHGHGWMFRAVFKKDRQGRLLDAQGQAIDFNDPEKWVKAVHLRDIHLDAGMHCVDCHFDRDVHGDGKLYGEVRNAVEITCVDCHGTYSRPTNLRTSGPAAPTGGADLSKMRIGPRQLKRFWIEGGKVYQRSTLNPQKVWEIVQTVDTINPDSAWAKAHPASAELSRRAKTMQKDGRTWGDLPADGDQAALAHSEEDLACYTCHTSWMTSCFGCHLPMEANQRTPMLHNESLYARNYTRYNYQVLRDEVFMLGRDSTVKGGKIVPVRSSSAVVVSSQNQNREWIYHQQQTVSGEGYSGQAFNPHFPHATSGPGTTKTCTDCHLSRSGDNNAWMAQLLLQGTNFVNFFGRYIYVATGEDGLEAVAATEHDEPQAVYGSNLHRLAYPDEHRRFVEERQRRLTEAYHHEAGWGGEILDLQLRGEYLYTARGRAGFYVYDVANIDNKGFSERIVTAPVSPLGQELGFKTRYAVCVASPSTLAVDPARTRLSDDPTKPRATIMDPVEPWHVNQEQPVHPMYAFLYIGDRDEGLVLTNAATLLDGDPDNNFLQRATFADGSNAFNPEGVLDGLTYLTLAGHYVYATARSGLVVIDVDQPLDPKVVAVVGPKFLNQPRCVAVQFRYAFVTDADGLRVIDITDPAKPVPVPGAKVPLADAHRLYVARTYAFVAAGREGLAIIEVTSPERPRLLQKFDADGRLGDVRDVKVGMTNASLFAYVADGRNGLRVLELMGPHTTPQFRGFTPPLDPRLIATYPTHGPALAVSKALDRDRAVDETGHQVAAFGRLGSRPLTLSETQRMFLRDGQVWTVTDEADTPPQPFTYQVPGIEGPKKKTDPSKRPSPGGPKKPKSDPAQ